MGVKFKEKCKKCFHFQVCAAVLQNDLFIREVLLGEKEPDCKQFVEVVLCKDCEKISPSVTTIKDAVWCREFRAHMPCNGFCSYGERREGE